MQRTSAAATRRFLTFLATVGCGIASGTSDGSVAADEAGSLRVGIVLRRHLTLATRVDPQRDRHDDSGFNALPRIAPARTAARS